MKSMPYRSVSCSVNNKRRRIGKPWRSDTLTCLWNKVCESERLWLKCNDICFKVSLKSTYCNNRKMFDKEVQKSKRSYWYKVQSDILDNQNEFWKSFGKIGISQNKKAKIPMLNFERQHI